ncbi:hypothetical protein Sjap_019726 [Stephania japonica]|uniref:Uncharacterized protein n=1 Tax=Stephania japonica TaxID=461633 RepID=A0AAP0F256_9MAGN
MHPSLICSMCKIIILGAKLVMLYANQISNNHKAYICLVVHRLPELPIVAAPIVVSDGVKWSPKCDLIGDLILSSQPYLNNLANSRRSDTRSRIVSHVQRIHSRHSYDDYPLLDNQSLEELLRLWADINGLSHDSHQHNHEQFVGAPPSYDPNTALSIVPNESSACSDMVMDMDKEEVMINIEDYLIDTPDKYYDQISISPLAIWPPTTPPQFSGDSSNCICCQVLREIVHYNGIYDYLQWHVKWLQVTAITIRAWPLKRHGGDMQVLLTRAAWLLFGGDFKKQGAMINDPLNPGNGALLSSSRVTLLCNMPVPENAKDAGVTLKNGLGSFCN